MATGTGLKSTIFALSYIMDLFYGIDNVSVVFFIKKGVMPYSILYIQKRAIGSFIYFWTFVCKMTRNSSLTHD